MTSLNHDVTKTYLIISTYVKKLLLIFYEYYKNLKNLKKNLKN